MDENVADRRRHKRFPLESESACAYLVELRDRYLGQEQCPLQNLSQKIGTGDPPEQPAPGYEIALLPSSPQVQHDLVRPPVSQNTQTPENDPQDKP